MKIYSKEEDVNDPIEVSINNGSDNMWISDNGGSNCEYLIQLGNWAEIGLNDSEIDQLINALRKIKNQL